MCRQCKEKNVVNFTKYLNSVIPAKECMPLAYFNLLESLPMFYIPKNFIPTISQVFFIEHAAGSRTEMIYTDAIARSIIDFMFKRVTEEQLMKVIREETDIELDKVMTPDDKEKLLSIVEEIVVGMSETIPDITTSKKVKA